MSEVRLPQEEVAVTLGRQGSRVPRIGARLFLFRAQFFTECHGLFSVVNYWGGYYFRRNMDFL